MNKNDEVYLRDMLEMIDKIDSFIEGMDVSQFEQDDKTQFAVFHAMEVIGEAANRLSEDFRERQPEIPVRKTVEMRNILIHGYDLIDLSIVWKTIQDHLPPLKDQLISVLQS